MWEHPHVFTPPSSIESPDSHQLSLLCLVTNPRTKPDYTHLTVTAYSVIRFIHSKIPLSSFSDSHSKLVCIYFSVLLQSNSLSLQSLLRDSQANHRFPSQQSTVSLPPSLTRVKRQFLGSQETEPHPGFWGPKKRPFYSASKTGPFRTPANEKTFRLLWS